MHCCLLTAGFCQGNTRTWSSRLLSRQESSADAAAVVVLCGSWTILHLFPSRLYPAHQYLQKNPQSNPLFPNKVLNFPDYMSAQSCQTPSSSLLTSSNLSARKNKFSSTRFFTSGSCESFLWVIVLCQDVQRSPLLCRDVQSSPVSEI